MVENVQIERLVTDARFQELKFGQERTNVFTIVGQTHTEHWHSSFLSWFFDPHSSLRLGHFPLARLLTLYMIKNPESGITLRDIYGWDLDAVRFCTEKNASYDGKKRSIDIYGESEELILVIENKVNAHENYNHSDQGQTMDYYRYVEQNKTKKQRAFYFFITADQKQQAFGDMYVHISYQEMYDYILSKCLEHPQISADGKYLLEQYASNLREMVRNSNTPMAMIHIDLCRSLYADHSETLDGIFAETDHTEDIHKSEAPSCIVYEHYKNIFDEIYLSLDEYRKTPKNSIRRQTVGLEDLYRRGSIESGMNFHLEYEGEQYHAVCIVKEDKTCVFQVLDEDKKPYLDESGEEIGIFDNSQSASVFAVNIRNRQKGKKERVKTLRGIADWINKDGVSIQDLLAEK